MVQIDMPMPEKCSECRFETECGFCKAMPDNFCGYTNDEGRPEWCPLKEQEPVEPKTGHWIYLQHCANEGVYCSECQTKMFDRYPMKKKLSQFCGHCGAKMTERSVKSDD